MGDGGGNAQEHDAVKSAEYVAEVGSVQPRRGNTHVPSLKVACEKKLRRRGLPLRSREIFRLLACDGRGSKVGEGRRARTRLSKLFAAVSLQPAYWHMLAVGATPGVPAER